MRLVELGVYGCTSEGAIAAGGWTARRDGPPAHGGGPFERFYSRTSVVDVTVTIGGGAAVGMSDVGYGVASGRRPRRGRTTWRPSTPQARTVMRGFMADPSASMRVVTGAAMS
jgi:hypothetical protein